MGVFRNELLSHICVKLVLTSSLLFELSSGNHPARGFVYYPVDDRTVE